VLGFSWQGALGAVFWSGVLTVIFSLTNIRVKILKSIPELLKIGLGASVGVFLLLIALKVAGLLVYDGIKLVGLGSIVSPSAWVFYFGFGLALLFKYFRVKGAVLLSIILASGLARLLGITQDVGIIELNRQAFSVFGALDLGIIFNPKVWSVVIILFVLDFYGSIAKFIGLTKNTSIVDENGNLPKLKEAMVVDGAGTVLGATLGTSNLITFVESAVGIGEGGRTGLVAVVVGLLMLLFIPLVPLLNLVPTVATTGALFAVGLSLIPFQRLRGIDWWEKLVLLAMLTVTLLTFGLDKALLAGFATFIFLAVLVGKRSLVNPYLLGSTLILFISLILDKLI
jgi:AGZA family xanthine/uracil permease-like MFS transporter